MGKVCEICNKEIENTVVEDLGQVRFRMYLCREHYVGQIKGRAKIKIIKPKGRILRVKDFLVFHFRRLHWHHEHLGNGDLAGGRLAHAHYMPLRFVVDRPQELTDSPKLGQHHHLLDLGSGNISEDDQFIPPARYLAIEGYLFAPLTFDEEGP